MTLNKKSCLENKLRCILTSSIFANFFMALILAAILVYKDRIDKTEIDNSGKLDSFNLPADSGVCIPCDYLGKNITAKDTLFDSITKSKDGKQKLCCTKKPSFLPKLIGKVINIYYS